MTIAFETELPPAPRHLSKEAKAWWAEVVSTYVLEPKRCNAGAAAPDFASAYALRASADSNPFRSSRSARRRIAPSELPAPRDLNSLQCKTRQMRALKANAISGVSKTGAIASSGRTYRFASGT